MRPTIIANPQAGRIGHLSNLVKRKPQSAVIRYAHSALELMALAKAAARRGEEFCSVAGGDGTLNLAARELIGTRTALWPFPIGRGNEFARACEVPEDLVKTLQLAVNGRIIEVDVGWIQSNDDQLDQPFLAMADLGFEALVAKAAQEKGQNSPLSYVFNLIKYLLFQPQQYHIRLEMSRSGYRQCCVGDVFSVAMANVPTEGRWFKIAPDAKINDGQLNICVIEPMSLPSRLTYAARVFLGKHLKRRETHYWPTTEVKIWLPDNCPGHIDGEPFMMKGGELRVWVLPGALRVLVPKAPAHV